MKILILLFGALTRVVFEWGIIALAWIHWGPAVGLAFLLWYILWSWMGLELYKHIVKEQEQKENSRPISNERDVVEFFKKLRELSEKAKEELEKEKGKK